MATAYYTQPPAANYHTPPMHKHREAQSHRICDHCGAFASSPNQFRACGGCLVTRYCSDECQKIGWHSHKAICRHNAEQTASARKQAYTLFGDENMVNCLRKFTSAHESLLQWAGYQALQLKRVPASIRQKALLIELDYNNHHSESHRRFSILDTHIVPIDFLRDDPENMAEIKQREARARASGGLGALIIILQCGTVHQVMPVDFPSLDKITWDPRDDWDPTLRHFVSEGRRDFKPISTTSKGIYYG